MNALGKGTKATGAMLGDVAVSCDADASGASSDFEAYSESLESIIAKCSTCSEILSLYRKQDDEQDAMDEDGASSPQQIETDMTPMHVDDAS